MFPSESSCINAVAVPEFVDLSSSTTFTFSHLADAFIQSNLQLGQSEMALVHTVLNPFKLFYIAKSVNMNKSKHLQLGLGLASDASPPAVASAFTQKNLSTGMYLKRYKCFVP